MSKKIQSNQDYFKISQENFEPHLDDSYFILQKNPELADYISNIKEIKEILITIKKLKEGKEERKIIEKYFKKLFKIFNQKFSNCSELGCFVNACDTTRDLVQKDYFVFKKITNFFLEKRELNDKVPENWVQAIIDSNSSRKKGELGEKKLIKILKNFGFKRVKNWEEFKKEKICVARFSKKIFSIENIKKEFKIKIPLKKQGKNLDLIIKYKDKIILLEAKHLNVGGGGQDKQISELIEILSLKKEKNNILYISFLDGTYSNALLEEISKKAKKKLKQRKQIEKYLRQNKQNYWLNTTGFKTFFADLTKK